MPGDEFESDVDGRDRNQPTLEEQRKRHAAAGGQALSFVIGLRAERPYRGDDTGLGVCWRWLEILAVTSGDFDAARVDEVRERVRQTEFGGPYAALWR